MDTRAQSDLRHVLGQALAEHGGARLTILFGSRHTEDVSAPAAAIALMEKHEGTPAPAARKWAFPEFKAPT